MGRPPAAIDPVHLQKLASTLSDEEIGVILGHARVTVTGARRRFGIPSFTEQTGLKRRDGEVTFGGRRKHVTFNERFFENLDCEASAYFLGLLAADGSLAKRGNTIEIQLAEPDHHILHDFARCLNCANAVVSPRRRPDRTKTFYRLALCSKAMANDLISWGVTPSKTEAMELCRPIPPAVLRHFVRGFWDGDGSIGRDHFEVGVRSQGFANQLRSMIRLVGGEMPPLRESRTKLGKPFYVMTVASRRFARFRSEIYRDAQLSIDRKHCSYLEHWC